MNYVVGLIGDYKKESLLLLILLVGLMLYGIGHAGFWFGIVSNFAMYFLLGLYVFSTIRPKEWEASIIFILYLIAAIWMIVCFSFVSIANQNLFHGGPDSPRLSGLWDHYFFSASMFTSLGFSDFKPISFEARFFAVAQSLLGNAHGVSFILVMLGRKRWLGQSEQAVEPASVTHRVLEVKLRQVTTTLRLVVGLLVLNFVVLLVFALR